MGKKTSPVKFKKAMAVIIAAVMVLGIAASVISVAFGAVYTGSTSYSNMGVNVDRSREDEVKNADMMIEGKVGYDGKYCLNAINPVSISLTNSGEDFEGEAGIKVFTQEGNESSGGEYVFYSKRISLKSGERADINFNIYMTVPKAAFITEVKDDSGVTVKSRNILSEPISGYNGLCAIIGADERDRERLAELDYTSDSYYKTIPNTVFIDADGLPEDEKMLNGFCAVIFRNGSYGALNDVQKNALKRWVKNGGYIIADETYGDYDTEESFNDIYFLCQVGKGCVYTGISPYDSEDSGLYAYKAVPIKRQAASNYDYLENTSTGTPLLETGTIKTLFVILIVYVCLIGPVLYIMLKKADKRSMAIALIPAISVAFVFIINAANRGSVYKNGIVNVYSRLEIGDGERAEGTSYIAFKAAETKSVELKAENMVFNPYKIYNQYYRYYYGNGFSPAVSLGTLYWDGNDVDMSLIQGNSWKPLTMKSNASIQLKGGLDTDFYMDGDMLKGDITNNTGIDLEDVVVTAFNTGERVEMLKDGESAEVEITVEERDDLGYDYYNNIVNNTFGVDASRYGVTEKYGKIDSGEGFKIINRIDILRSETERYVDTEGTSPRVKIIAFNGENLTDSSFKANGKKTMEFYENIIIKNDSIDYAKENYEIAYGNILPDSITSSVQNITGSYGLNYIYTLDEDLIYTYSVPDEDTVEEFKFNWNGLPVLRDGKGKEQIFIYNCAAGEWEYLSSSAYENTADYIDGSSRIKLKLRLTAEGEWPDPGIEVKGGGK